jgi:hypothetical protein
MQPAELLLGRNLVGKLYHLCMVLVVGDMDLAGNREDLEHSHLKVEHIEDRMARSMEGLQCWLRNRADDMLSNAHLLRLAEEDIVTLPALLEEDSLRFARDTTCWTGGSPR